VASGSYGRRRWWLVGRYCLGTAADARASWRCDTAAEGRPRRRQTDSVVGRRTDQRPNEARTDPPGDRRRTLSTTHAYTEGDVTSQSLWSRDDRHFVGITRYNALRYMAKIDHVIRIKLNQFKKMDIWSLTYQQSVCKRYHSDKHFSDFYLQDGGNNQLA